MDTTLIITVALASAIIVALLVLVGIIIYQRWRIGDQNVFIDRFFRQNEEQREMKRIVTIVALICAMTFQVNAQSIEVEPIRKDTVAENVRKNAEAAVKLADKNPKDGMKQLRAADALTAAALDDKSQFDRAIDYAHKALKIAQAQKELKDTLLAGSCMVLSKIYLFQNSMDNAIDYLEMAVDAYEKELGRYDPVTIYNRLYAGRVIISAYPDTRRGFLHILQAFYDNDTAPADKRIKSMPRINVQMNEAMELFLAAYVNSNRYAVPTVMMDGEKYFIVQTRDWCVGQPLVNWMTPNILRSEAERQAHAGEDIIVVNDKTSEFRRLTKEEGQQCRLEFEYHFNADTHDIDVNPNSGSVMYFPPQTYNEIVRLFQEFKDRCR